MMVFQNLIAQEIGKSIIRNYSPREYQNEPQIWHIIQDNRGILYFGINGIMEYDGVQWKTIPSAKNLVVYNFTKDINGRIYVGAVGNFGFLETDHRGNVCFQSLRQLIKDTTFRISTIRSIRVGSNKVYFRAYDSIIEFDTKDSTINIYKSQTGELFLSDFLFEDTFYVVSSKTGLQKMENLKLSPVPASVKLKDIRTQLTIIQHFNKHFLISKRNGFFSFNLSGDTSLSEFKISDVSFMEKNIVNSIHPFYKYLLIGSVARGAILINHQGKTLQSYSESSNLQDNNVYKVFSDTNQNIWFGLANGISKSEHGLDLTFWDKNSGLKDNVESVIRFRDTIYIATQQKVYYIDKDNKISEIKNLALGQYWYLMEMKGFNRLLLAGNNGLYEIEGKKARQVFYGWHNFTMHQSTINPERIYCTSGNYLISLRLKDNKWHFEGYWKGIVDEIRGITEDEQGYLWIATLLNGIIKIKLNTENIALPKQIEYYEESKGLPSLTNVYPMRYQNKIIWGSKKGLFIYNKISNRFEKFNEFGAQFCNGSRDVFRMQEMPNGNILIAPVNNNNAEIGYLKPSKSADYQWVTSAFKRIPDIYIKTIYVEPSGIIWIGGSAGLFRYDPAKDTKDYSQKFHCLVRKVAIQSDSLVFGGYHCWSGDKKSIEAPINLKYKNNSIRFEFAAPFFDQEEKTLYSSKLEGFDTEWSKWGKQTTREYTNLNEGNYIFKVKALNVYNIASYIDEFHFIIEPPFYRTWWSYLLYFIFGLFIINLIVRIYTRILKYQKLKLENIIKIRTRKIDDQKAEILTINNELLATNEELRLTLESLKRTQNQLIQSEKMSSLGILAAGIAHEINNPLNFIQGGIIGLENYFNENLSSHISSVTPMLNGLQVGVNRASSIVNNLNQYCKNDTENRIKSDIHQVLENCLCLIENINVSKIKIVRKYFKEPLVVEIFEQKIQQALLNILINANQAIEKSGTITISTEKLTRHISISISDDGIGIEDNLLHKVFDPFFTTKDPGKGTGLGLSIAYNIVQEHMGIIEISSKAGEGTTVVVTLPVNIDN